MQYEDERAAVGYASSYDVASPGARYFQSRLHAVIPALRGVPGGDLLDVGCGPGLLIERVAAARPTEFTYSGVDASAAMVRTAATRLGGVGGARLVVGKAESLPFPDQSFDVVVGTGVLEYCDMDAGLEEIARAVRPGGLVMVTMLNPLSPYRLFEWGVYWPVVRLLGRLERLLGRTPRHGAVRSGIRTVSASRLSRLMRERGLVVDDLVYYDLNLLLPPVDKFVRRRSPRWRDQPQRTVGRGPRGWTGTGYLIVAHREERATAPVRSSRRPILARDSQVNA